MKLKDMKRPAETPPGAPIYGFTRATVVCFLGENMETNEEKDATPVCKIVAVYTHEFLKKNTFCFFRKAFDFSSMHLSVK